MGEGTLNIKIIILAVGLFIAVVTIIGNWIAIKVSYGKDIKSHEIRLNKHSIKLNEIDDDLQQKQSLTGCGDWRKEVNKNVDRLEHTHNSQVAEIRQDLKDLNRKEEARTIRIYNKLDAIQKDQLKLNGGK